MNDERFSTKINPEIKKKFMEKLFEKYFWGKEKFIIEEFMKKFINGDCQKCMNFEEKRSNRKIYK